MIWFISIMFLVKLCSSSKFHREAGKTGGGPNPDLPDQPSGDVMDDLPDPEGPRPATWPLDAPGASSGRQPGTQPRGGCPPVPPLKPLPGTWPPPSHVHNPAFDPMIDYTGNHLTLAPPKNKTEACMISK